MELRSLAVLLGLCLLAVSQCSEARHAMERRDANDGDFLADEASDDDTFPADEASEDDGTQNDDEDSEPVIKATITTRPMTYEVDLGSDVRLECKVDPDSGTVVQWFKNNSLIFLGTMKIESDIIDSRYNMLHDSKDLLISKVEPADCDVYRCEVAQEVVTAKVEHKLFLFEAPEITKFTATNNGNLIEGEDLLLTCDVQGRPPPQIVWSRTSENGNQRLGEQDGEFSVNSVFVKNIKREHSGKYYCYAFNNKGNNQGELRVSVAGKPRVHVHKTVINSAINVEAVLQCSARYESNPHIHWYKDGLLISDSSTHYEISTFGPHSNLTVTPTSDTDFGNFTCEAENDIGKHSRSIELVQKPVIASLGAESGRLSWTINSHQPLQEIIAQVHALDDIEDAQWKEFAIPLPSEHHHKYEIVYDLRDKVDAGKYEAVVKVKNDHSWSDGVDPIVFDIEIEPESIQHASVFFGEAHSIRPSSIVLSTILMYVLVRLL